jgi:hypothetical protein
VLSWSALPWPKGMLRLTQPCRAAINLRLLQPSSCPNFPVSSPFITGQEFVPAVLWIIHILAPFRGLLASLSHPAIIGMGWCQLLLRQRFLRKWCAGKSRLLIPLPTRSRLCLDQDPVSSAGNAETGTSCPVFLRQQFDSSV